MRISYLCGLAMLVGCNQQGVTTGEFLELRDRVEALEEANDALAAENDALQDQIDAGASNDDLSALDGRLASLETEAVRLIDADTTLAVPADHATLQDALTWLDGYRIAGDAWVTIQIAPGTYEFSEAILFQHPNGHRISIEGDLDDPSSTVLHFTGDGDSPGWGRALRARSSGATVGWFDGITVRGNDEDGTVGIEASDGATFWVGPNVVVEGFGRAGFRATRGSSLYAEGATAKSNPGHGFLAEHASFVAAWGATSTDNGQHGFLAVNSSAIAASPATATGNGGHGFAAVRSSAIAAWNATASDNGSNGFGAFMGGSVAAGGGSASGNGGNGFGAWASGSMDAYQTTSSENGGSGFDASMGSAVNAGESTASDNGESGFTAGMSSGLVANQGVSQDNGRVGFQAGPTSTLATWGSATASGNSEGVTAHGNGFADVNGVTATDNTTFNFNVFWGGWMLATDTTSSGAEHDYNIGPWSNDDPLPSQDGWGVIWEDVEQ